MLGLLAALYGQGAAGTDIVGAVRSGADGAPLPGANVTLTGGTLERMTGGAADEEGRYRIPGIPPGAYLLSVSYIGYHTEEREVVIGPGSGPQVVIDFDLKIESILLREYVVTASRGRREKLTDAPAATIVLSSIEIRRQSQPNLGDYLKHIKGIDFTASGIDGFNLSARGFNTSFSSRLMTLTDGRKANVPSLRLIAYNTIPITSDDVDQIEVVLGPASALYGPDAYAGVVNIITRKPALSTGGTVSVAAGNRDLRKWQLRYAGARGRWGYKVSYADFSARDWRWTDPEEKKGHHRFWVEDSGEIGEQLDNNSFPYPWTWDGYDIRFDRNRNGDFRDPYDSVAYALDNIIADANRDGLADTADFHVENQRLDLRLDYDFGPEHSLIAGFGQARATNLNITGVGRYLADGWLYRYYQARYIRGGFFAQAYLNTSSAGRTRNLRTGERIYDESTFFHLQIQHSRTLPRLLATQLAWGFDYMRTMPQTFGTILPDGTGGRQPRSYHRDGRDNDGDGRVDEFAEGLITTNEYGIYFQSTSSLTRHLSLVLAGRLDLHSGVTTSRGVTFLEDPLQGGTVTYRPQLSPKFGLLWKPDENQTVRLTAARAFNTPSSQALYLDMHVGALGIFPAHARGNRAGYHYSRDSSSRLLMYDVRAGSPTEWRLAPLPEGAVLYIPPLLGRPEQWLQAKDLTDVEPIVSEDLWTWELGYTGVPGGRMRITADLYYSEFGGFVSDLTWLTPLVMDTTGGRGSPRMLGVIGTREHDGILEGPDGIPGTADDTTDFDHPIELTLTNVNYGRVSLGGLDMSMGYFFTPRLWGEARFSYLGRQAFYNPLTRSYDPINAPRYKVSAGAVYTGREGRFWFGLSLRHIPSFDWSAGVFVGTIPRYTVADANLGYRLSDIYTLKGTINNVTDYRHREIIGGAELGRQVIVSLTMNI